VMKAVTMNEAELFIRLLEIGVKLKRPKGKTRLEILDQIDQSVACGQIPAYIVEDFKAMTKAAIDYFSECVSAGKSLN
jgi:hypothetical protein